MCDISNGNIQSVSPGSHYAVLIALKALKSRYDKLKKIIQIHDENINNNKKKDNRSYDTLNLLGTIEVLERQKQQLSHHIFQLVSENRELHDEIHKLNKENVMLKSKLDESQIDGSITETRQEPEEKEAKRLDSVSDDEDSDVVVLSDDESIENVSLQQYDIEDEISKILNKLKTEKSMLESFQEDILSVLSEINIIDSTSVKGQNFKNDNAKNIFDVESENQTKKSLNSYEICPNCHHIMLKNVDEADKEMLLRSFEIISCRCK